MLADNVLGWEIVLKISYLPSKLRLSAKYSFFGQSLSRGHYQPTYQPPEGVYLLNIHYFHEFLSYQDVFQSQISMNTSLEHIMYHHQRVNNLLGPLDNT